MDLRTALSTIEGAIGRRLREGEVAHTFNDSGDLDIDGRRVRRVDASRIEEDRDIGVVLFKMSLSTGWDCPRAEVMMSFRRAQDHTFIAQLLGRMVRTPLARRVEVDAALNDVHLFLPHYDQAAVKSVIEDLKDVEEVPPAETGTSRELVTLKRREGTEEIFAAIEGLVTYRVNAVRKQSGLRRLMGLGRALTQDRIDEDAQNGVKSLLVDRMNAEIQRLRDAGVLDDRAKRITGIDLRTIAVRHGTDIAEDEGEYSIEAISADIERHFEQAGRLLGSGLHMEYWKAHADRDAEIVKVEAIVLAQDHDGMRHLENCAEKEFDRWYEQHKRDIGRLKEQRRSQYEKLRLATSNPQDIPWHLPEVIDFRRSAKAPLFEKHLYMEEDGRFRADLGTWEREVFEEELQDSSVVAWLRNLDRKAWSLEIPYRYSGTPRPMFPDLLIVRKDARGFLFDILEPHDPSLGDNYAKAVGLAQFAERHGHLFGRIELIRKNRTLAGGERYFRLDLNRIDVRRQVLPINSNEQLDQIFGREAT
jgi:type III restriction enzyme